MRKSVTSFTKFLGISGAALLIATAMPAHAVPVLDQEHNPFQNIEGNIGPHSGSRIDDRAQTFTVGVTGILSRIEIRVYNRDLVATQPLIIDIRTVVGGVPTEADFGPNILERHSVAAALVPTTGLVFVGVDLAGIAVTAGDVLAIAASTTDTANFSFIWGGTNTDLYAGGAQYNRVTGVPYNLNAGIRDLNFRTFVEVPAPGVALILAMGLAGLGVTRRKRNI